MHIVMAGDYPRDPGQVSGGVEAVTLYLTQALQSYPDLKLDVVTLDIVETEEQIENYGNVTVYYLPSVRLPSRLSVVGNIRRIRAKMTHLQPDLIHAQVAGIYAAAAAKTGLPWVLTLHGIRFLEVDLWRGYLNKYRGWFIKQEELRAIRQANHLISISPFIQETFDGQIKGRVYDIENPIADAFFKLPQNSKPGQLLYVGRLIPRKDALTLLRAFAELHRRMPQATLHLAGGGISANDPADYPQRLKQFVAEAGLTKAVTFLGELDEPAILEEYASCSALVMSSVLETAPMVIMQAMAAGKAVVSTDVGGARYLIDHGQTGLIVPPKDKQALADALYRVLENEVMLQDMGRRAKAVAQQRFHAKAVAEQTRDVYYRILGRMTSGG